MPERFDASPVRLDALFGHAMQTLHVPEFQRRFNWGREELEQLWTDITESIERDDSEYFLGPIVLDKPQPVRKVIDGQQRLVTMTVILAVLRNRLEDLGVTTAANKLHEIIVRTNLQGQALEPVLSLGYEDQESFRRYVQTRPSENGHLAPDTPIPTGKPGRPPRNRVREAMRLFTDKLNNESNVQYLVNLAEFIKDRITFISIIVEEEDDAYTVFESFNARGMELSTADLT